MRLGGEMGEEFYVLKVGSINNDGGIDGNEGILYIKVWVNNRDDNACNLLSCI